MARNGAGSSGLLERLSAVEAELDRVSRRVREARRELVVLEDQVFDEDDLRQAVASFDPVWDQLFPAERKHNRILNRRCPMACRNGARSPSGMR